MNEDGRGPPPKVARVIDAYDLEGLGERLEARWTAEDGDSLRDLADVFNERVLEAAVEAADARPIDQDVETLYRRLTADDVSEGVRTRTRRTLEREGIDVERVTDDFVSHQAVHTYLREYRGAEKPTPSPEEKRERVRNRVRKLRNRTVAVSEDAVATLQREGLVPDGEFDVLVDVRVLYRDSGEQHEIGDLLSED
ncbi:MAG: rod-determining factor RdfA [Haloarculaceae archaeon]